MEKKISLNHFFEALGIKTYEDFKKTKENPNPYWNGAEQNLDYIEEINKIAEFNAETYTLGEFIPQWVDSRGKGYHDKIERFAVLLPKEMPWGSMAYALSILLNNNETLTRIAEALREDGYTVYHNRTGIDAYDPRTKVKVFLFEDKDSHLIWFLKKA
ncbi:protein of unknown function (plasmid) [Thermococcus nautili]|uniref:hypothetical protein n=1 Tax=Thermococcus nautili TaxID=195522 RepID=UPI002556B7A8|nr:hypothetical protein [Thermococcus nautili]CAI1494144.1 protein of unknown function [Thermococcus nautili]